MKNLALTLTMAIITLFASAQLKQTVVCSPFVVDILDGNVNGVQPDDNPGQIKTILPCATSVEPETSKCGGGVFYKDKDLYFFTGRDYIEIREKFKGKLTIPLMGASRSGLFKWLGHPKIKDVTWDAFQMSYGTLVLHYNKANKVNLIQFSKKGTGELTLCE